MKNKSCQEKIRDWYENLYTPSNAWREWTLQEIATAAGVSTISIQLHLPKLVYANLLTTQPYIRFRKVRKDAAKSKKRKGNRLSEEQIDQIIELREKYTIFEVSDITGHCSTTIQKYSSKEYKQMLSHYHAGIEKASQGNYEASLLEFDAALHFKSVDNASVYLKRAQVRYKLKKYKMAISDYSEAIKFGSPYWSVEEKMHAHLSRAKAFVGHIRQTNDILKEPNIVTDLQLARHYAQQSGNNEIVTQISEELSRYNAFQ